MDSRSSVTNAVVGNHLQAFLEQRGLPAILEDYDEAALFFTEPKIHRGRREIETFFRDFIGALPEGAIDRFALRSMQVDDDVAYITWSVGDDIPLGTDTFVVADGKIVSQTFAMYAGPVDGARQGR